MNNDTYYLQAAAEAVSNFQIGFETVNFLTNIRVTQ